MQAPDAAPGRHRLVGHLNPHCTVCGRTAMQIAQAPTTPCRRMTLPFEELDLKPLKAGLPKAATKAK